MTDLATPCPDCGYMRDTPNHEFACLELKPDVTTEVVDARRGVYGDVEESFTRIAQVWSGILGHEVQPWEVPLCLIGLKCVRADYAPDYSDNADDILGYEKIFREIIGDDMIDARSVAEYLQLKGI